MFKKSLLTFLLVAVFAAPTISSAMTRDDLLAQIAQLLELVSSLQAQLTTVESTPVTVTDFDSCVAVTGIVMESYPRQCAYKGTTYVEDISINIPTAPTCPSVIRNIGIGMKGADVTSLQQFLKTTGDFTYPEFTSYYGSVTQQAVQAFQCRELGICSGSIASNGYGFVGPQTRAALTRVCGTPIITPEPEPPVICTLEYAPVCGLKNGVYTTYGNRCQLNGAGATFYAQGECGAVPPVTPPSTTLPPVVHGISGPTVIAQGVQGTWEVQASDPEDGALSYRIDWGDSGATADAFTAIESLAGGTFVQQTSFTHVYTTVGTYTITITARDTQGLTAQATTTVRVDADGSTEGFVVAPVSGFVPMTTTATITLPTRPAGFEICGPIGVGEVSWGDGIVDKPTRLGCSSQRVVSLSHTYTQPGTYTITYTRDDGRRFFQTVTVRSFLDGLTSTGVTLNTYTPSISTTPNYQQETCQGGSTYAGGFYEECNTPQHTLSVFEPSGGFYNMGDTINVAWSTNVDTANTGMYLVLEDASTGKRFKSIKVDKAAGSASITTGDNCNFFFSDGIEPTCQSIYNNSFSGKTQYRIRAGIYTPENTCFGFCTPDSPQLESVLLESYSSAFSLNI